MLRLSLKPSRYLAAVLALGHLAALACVALVPLPLWLKISLSVVLLVSLMRSLTRDANLSTPASIIELACDREGSVYVKTRNGKEFEARVLGSSFVASYLTVVLLKPHASRRVRAALVLPDAVNPELFRQLRVWLKWRVGRGVEPEVSAGWAGRI